MQVSVSTLLGCCSILGSDSSEEQETGEEKPVENTPRGGVPGGGLVAQGPAASAPASLCSDFSQAELK